jgi:hypothetical protein
MHTKRAYNDRMKSTLARAVRSALSLSQHSEVRLRLVAFEKGGQERLIADVVLQILSRNNLSNR